MLLVNASGIQVYKACGAMSWQFWQLNARGPVSHNGLEALPPPFTLSVTDDASGLDDRISSASMTCRGCSTAQQISHEILRQWNMLYALLPSLERCCLVNTEVRGRNGGASELVKVQDSGMEGEKTLGP